MQNKTNSFKPSMQLNANFDVSNDSISIQRSDQYKLRGPSPISNKINRSELAPRSRDVTPKKTTYLRTPNEYSPIPQRVFFNNLNPQADQLSQQQRNLHDSLLENFEIISNKFKILDAIDEIRIDEENKSKKTALTAEKTKSFERTADVFKRTIPLRIREAFESKTAEENENAFEDLFNVFIPDLEDNMLKNVDMDRNTVAVIYENDPQSLIEDLGELLRVLPAFLGEVKKENEVLENSVKQEFAKLKNKQGERIDRSKVEDERSRAREILLMNADNLI